MSQWLGTSANLTANETRTLGEIQVGTQDRLLGLVKSDKNLTVHILESIDGGVNYDRDTTVAVTGGTTSVIDLNPIYGNTIRITVTVGGVATTYIRFGARLTSAGAR